MNNREWLNTLSDEEFTDVIQMQMAKASGFDGYTNSTDFLKRWHNYLQAEHITTADEDFAEIGFKEKEQGVTYAEYKDYGGKVFYMAECGTNTYTNDDGKDAQWTDDEIDQIRKIADKKRKEMGWK